jgi:hypothetical protein
VAFARASHPTKSRRVLRGIELVTGDSSLSNTTPLRHLVVIQQEHFLGQLLLNLLL